MKGLQKEMEAKKLTNNSYMIFDKFNNRLGLAFINDSSVYYSYNNQEYKSIEDIAKSIDETVTYTEIATFEKDKSVIEDYPVKHDIVYDPSHVSISLNNQDIMVWTYKTREESTIYFCAGWWVILIENSGVYRVSLSPKQKTITENTSIGPFKDKFTAQAELNRVNNERVKLQKS